MLRRGLLLASFALLALPGCKPQKPKEISVQQVAEGLKAGTLHVFDANEEAFRRKNGVVPGAVLLAEFDAYDVKATLPADKASPIVFYCTSRL